MLVSLQMASFYHRTTFLLEHFHLVLMREKVLMKYCTQYQIMVTWTRCYFMYSWINCSFQKPDIQQVKNFLMSTALIKPDSQNVVHTLWIETLSTKADSVNIKCTLLQHQIHDQAVHYLIQFQRHHLSRKISQMKDHMKNN